MNIFDFTKEKDSDKEYPYKILVYPNITYMRDLEKDSYVVVLRNVIKELNETVSATNDADLGDLVILVKVKGRYVRFSTKIDDTVGVVGFIETLKHDILRRASGE